MIFQIVAPLAIILLMVIGVVQYFQSEKALLEEKTCIKETNKTYSKLTKQKGDIYRIDKVVDDDKYAISKYHQRAWLYLKERPVEYFKENKTFIYEEVDCPDQSGKPKMRSIRDTVKTLKFKFGS